MSMTMMTKAADVHPASPHGLAGLDEPADDSPADRPVLVRSFRGDGLPMILARTAPGRFAAPLLSTEVWTEGAHRAAAPALPPDGTPFDLQQNPAICLNTALGGVRFYIAQSSLDALAYDWGLRPTGTRLAASFGGRDQTLHGLAQTLVAFMEQPDSGSALFADYAALAFHVHVVRTYGKRSEAKRPPRGGLAPWQLRRSTQYIDAHLDGDPSIAQLARECGLSPNHFARAFRQATGLPPHQYLTAQRVARAKRLLREGTANLVEIALACGFVDQSHLTRVFGRLEGVSPGKWRRSQCLEMAA